MTTDDTDDFPLTSWSAHARAPGTDSMESRPWSSVVRGCGRITDDTDDFSQLSEGRPAQEPRGCRMTQRVARGSPPGPAQLASRPACRGSLTAEAPIDAGSRVRIPAWLRSGPDGTPWRSREVEPYPKGGRAQAHQSVRIRRIRGG
jgi:hypothetical protein